MDMGHLYGFLFAAGEHATSDLFFASERSRSHGWPIAERWAFKKPILLKLSAKASGR
jgi:hypothetical protein